PQETAVTGAPTVSTIGVTTQKCPELVPPSPLGAYDGRGKWAAVSVICGSVGVDSVTTPSWGEEAQAESRHAISKASTADKAACFVTGANLLLAKLDATGGAGGIDYEKATRQEKILRRNGSSRLVQHGRQLGRA